MANTTKLFVALAAAFAAQTAMAGFEFNGYLRSGSGSSSKDGKETCFRLNGDSALGAGSIGAAGRLGNECDTYGELALGDTMGESDGTKFGIHTLMAFGAQQNADYEQSIPAWREAYGSAQGFGKGAFAKATAWVGKRYYNRKDVHIVDFFWLEVTGPGGGIENIDLGFGKFSYALMRAGDNNYQQLVTGSGGTTTVQVLNPDGTPKLDALGNPIYTQVPTSLTTDSQQLGRVTTVGDPTKQKSNHDFRLEGINLGSAGSLGVGANIIVSNNNATTGHNKGGYSAWASHSIASGGLQNGLTFQYAKDAGSLNGAGLSWFDDTKGDHSAWRLIDMVNFEFGEHWNGQAFLAYGKEKFSWYKADKTSTSFVVRPVYHFTDTYSIAFEAGRSQVKGDTADIANGTNHLNKLTIAPQISMGGGFYSRPVLRAYYTTASWNTGGASACTGRDCLVSVSSFANETSGQSYGLQMEAWW
jgi:maltoporin